MLLRRPTTADEDEVREMNRASGAHYRRWIAPPISAEAFSAYVERCARDDFEGLLVCRIADAAVMGSINLSQIYRGPFRSCFAGYWIGERYARRGYMTEALGLALAHAFGTLALHRVEANIQPGNTASIALVKKVGFSLEGFSPRYLHVDGEWRDHERWAILAEEWAGEWSRDPRG